jgi:hypothetical protein
MKDRIIKLENVSWRDIQDLQPDELKTIYNYEHLKKSLLTNGFANPLFVWEDKGVLWSVDGKTRREVLMDISNDIEVPEQLPAIFIKAKDRKEAIKILLEVFNAKENPSNEGVLIEWLEIENIDIQEVNIESVNVVSETIEAESEQNEDDKYTKKISTPVYEPKNEKPQISVLYDSEKYKDLITNIENSSLDNDIKVFLKVAASRHIVFNYENIADFYANSEKSIQELMEESALVIIDFNKAIESGFIRMSNELVNEYIEEYE